MSAGDAQPLIGIVDSGTSPTTPAIAARAFRDGADGIESGDASADAIGHATETLRLVRSAAPRAALAVAQVFFDSMSAKPDAVADSVNWLTGIGATIVNLSLGTTEDSAALRDSCRRALEAGCILVASVPARGPVVFPGAYDGIVRVTGDARCAAGQFSHIRTKRVDFGACPHAGDDRYRAGAAGGASIAAARVTAALAGLVEAGIARGEAIAALVARCHVAGPQTRPVTQALGCARR